MSWLTKENAIKVFTTFFYWAALFLVFIMVESFTGMISGLLAVKEGVLTVLGVLVASLVLTIYSIAIPPMRQFLDAQFESGEIDEKIELMHNDVKELKHEIDELKLLLQELRVNMKKESE